MSEVKKGDNVTLHYTGTLKNGEQFDSSEGREPLSFEAGSGQVIEGFDEAVIGMKADEKKTVTIPADKAYGQVREELVYEVPRSSIPPNIKPEKGMRLVSNLSDGRQIPVTVKEVTDEHVILDANHPLAGEDLTFEIKIVSIG
ncbi:MAG: peptidylprolyl isomerase [Salibacteraceae bacterium]